MQAVNAQAADVEAQSLEQLSEERAKMQARLHHMQQECDAAVVTAKGTADR